MCKPIKITSLMLLLEQRVKLLWVAASWPAARVWSLQSSVLPGPLPAATCDPLLTQNSQALASVLATAEKLSVQANLCHIMWFQFHFDRLHGSLLLSSDQLLSNYGHAMNPFPSAQHKRFISHNIEKTALLFHYDGDASESQSRNWTCPLPPHSSHNARKSVWT